MEKIKSAFQQILLYFLCSPKISIKLISLGIGTGESLRKFGAAFEAKSCLGKASMSFSTYFVERNVGLPALLAEAGRLRVFVATTGAWLACGDFFGQFHNEPSDGLKAFFHLATISSRS